MCERGGPSFKRAFAVGIPLMTYASLRFSDVQRLRIIGANNDLIRGAPLLSKTEKHHGLPRPRDFPRMGVTGSAEWVNPPPEFRAAHTKQNGSSPSFTFPRLNRRWELECSEPATYSPTLRKLEIARTWLGDVDGGRTPCSRIKTTYRRRRLI